MFALNYIAQSNAQTNMPPSVFRLVPGEKPVSHCSAKTGRGIIVPSHYPQTTWGLMGKAKNEKMENND